MHASFSIGVIALVISASNASAQSVGPRTYANPIDIDYRYNFEQLNQGISYRSGADPVIVVHRGEYYLFETIGEGYWRSRDLGTWQHITPSRWPLTDIVAPAALSVRDTIYVLPSATSPLPILMLTEPATGRVEFYNRLLPWLPMARSSEPGVFAKPDSVQPGPWDPQFFHDPDTNRWFLYWNSSNVYPLHVIELDKTKRLAYKGTPRWLFGLDPAKHGWERFGQDHRDSTIKPFIEGAWMTKHRGRYYLQYGAPGTEYNVYANGVYVSDDPLGPFSYAPYNPVAYKPGGFVQGAGHGNTFQDVHGNWWNTGTPWIAVNWNFERRIAMHPAGFDGDGQMYVDTRFGDFPRWLPTKLYSRSDELFTGWMLLSYRRTAQATSARDSFPASNVTDENPRTFWVATQKRPGESVTVDLGRAYDVKAIQLNYADYKSGLYGTDSTVYTQFRLSTSLDGRQWKTVADLSRERRDRPNAYLQLSAPTRARFVRYEHIHVGAANLAISDIRVFGNGNGGRPATPAGLTALRDRDERNAVITWRVVPGVVGYNVRWGISPSKLYQTYQRFADQGTTLELRALTVGQPYWVAIESFDENGVSTLSSVVPIRDTSPKNAFLGESVPKDPRLRADELVAALARGVPPALRVFASFSPNDAKDRDTWIPIVRQVTHPSMPGCPPPPQCDPTDDSLVAPLQPGIADVGLIFLQRTPKGIRPARLAEQGTLEKSEGAQTTIVGYGTTVPRNPRGSRPDTSTWDGKRRIRTSNIRRVIDETWALWSIPSYVCSGDSGGAIFMNARPDKENRGEELVANVSDGGKDCRGHNNNNRLDTRSIQNWINETIRQQLGDH